MPGHSIYSEPEATLEETYIVEIITPGRLAEPAEIPRAVELLSRKLTGWDYQIGYSRFHIPPKTYSDKAVKAGEQHGERTVDNVWVEARNVVRKKTFTATWNDGKFVDAIWGNRLVNSRMLAKLISGEMDDPPHVEYVPKIQREKDFE